jgi:fatty-acyl-CoA synthase
VSEVLDLDDWIGHHAAQTPTRIAIHYEDEQLSYFDLACTVETYARYLSEDLALATGARIAYLGANTPEALALLFACVRIGLIFVPLNWRLAAPEIDTILADCAPAILVVEGSCLTLAQQLRTQHSLLRITVRAGTESPALPTRANTLHATHRAHAPDRPVLIAYTSGTTGDPKGAVFTSRALVSNARSAVHMHGLNAGDRVLTALPLFHVGGLNIQTLPALGVGAEVVLLPRFQPRLALAAVANLRPTLAVLVPAALQAMVDDPAWTTTDLSSLRAMTTGSTDVPLALIHTWHARHVPVIQVYGATETAPIAIYQRLDEAFTTVGSIGRVGIETEIRLVANGVECAVDEPGEIWVRGAHLAAGYWKHSRIEAFADGWFHSGDVALRDRQGLFWFQDRIKNVVISGGENIYPAELERILLEHAAIREAAVVGRPDPRWGAVPVAVIVARTPITTAEILALFEDRVARYKIPKNVITLETLPRNTLGKIDHASLRRLVAAQN